MLTSPDNIPTPDPANNYNLTQDLAALADGVQSALTKRANYAVGTTTERNAALTLVPNGAKWYDTTLSSEHRKVAGAWKIWASDWVATTPAVTASTGTFTTVSCAFRSKYAAGAYLYSATVTITDLGTASGNIHIAFPPPLVVASVGIAYNISNGMAGTALAYPGDLVIKLRSYNATSLMSPSGIITCSGVLEIA